MSSGIVNKFECVVAAKHQPNKWGKGGSKRVGGHDSNSPLDVADTTNTCQGGK